jgi:hypothetical protein
VVSCGCKWLCCWRENPGEENQFINFLKEQKEGAEECVKIEYIRTLCKKNIAITKKYFREHDHACVFAFSTKILTIVFGKLNERAKNR